jgi:hypothetical protein
VGAADEMGLLIVALRERGAMRHVPSLIKICSSVQKLFKLYEHPNQASESIKEDTPLTATDCLR